jgi:hypothetical protein
MTLAAFWSSLEESAIAQRIGESWWFPLLESIHVVAIVLVIGSILMVDLRLIGVTARRYPVSRMSSELVPWTWAAFVLSVITGTGLFITRADHYADNIAFRWKFALLLLAGVNMACFHFGVFRRVANWDTARTPLAAKTSAVLSLLLWAGVILAGRWVGHLS